MNEALCIYTMWIHNRKADVDAGGRLLLEDIVRLIALQADCKQMAEIDDDDGDKWQALADLIETMRTGGDL